MLTFVEFRQRVAPKEVCNRVEAKHRYRNYIIDYKMCTPEIMYYQKSSIDTFRSLSDCKLAATPKLKDWASLNLNEEQGNNPMAYDTIKSTAAVASIINAASDESKQREFLLEELRRFSPYDWRTPFDAVLQKQFNIDAPSAPRSSQELLDMFKAGSFTVDQTKVDANARYNQVDFDGSCEDADGNFIGSMYYGITFTTLPIEDRKGYQKAKEEFASALKDTKRTIMIGTPAEGLAALKALEAWTTTVVPNTAPATTEAA